MLTVTIESHELSRDHTRAMRIIEQGGIARISRNGAARFYTLTPAERQVHLRQLAEDFELSHARGGQ